MHAGPNQTHDLDPFTLDHDQLHALAAADLVRDGLRHYRDNRVAELQLDGVYLRADVEDEEDEEIVALELSYDADGNLVCLCDCGTPSDRPCVHALAALFARSARGTAEGELLGAVEGAIDERIKRGRTEVRVEHVSGDPAYGAWNARSLVSSTHVPASYRVHIRSLDRRANYCTCPDFATNQLGTCKHIEAVLHRIAKRRDAKRLQALGPPSPFVYLDWEGDPAPQIRLHRAMQRPDNPLDPELVELLDAHFDDAGTYRRRLPEDFLRLADALAGRADIDLGEDALGYARRLAEQAAQRQRARDIGETIRASGGRLPGVTARLYPYQVEGVAFLAANGRALLADDMGLGKTLQAIAAAAWLHAHAEVERILVICPASLKQQWAREIRKFTGQEARVIQGPAAARAAQYRGAGGFLVVNYELILRDGSVIAETLRPDLVILDEAQRIKNWRTKIAAAVKRIPSRYAFVLTGTPLENRLEDLYSLMQVIDQRVLGPLWRYLVDFHVTDERGKVLGYRNLSELRRRLAPVMLRRDRQLVRDQLPDRIESRLDIPLDACQQELHDAGIQAAGILAQIAKRRPLTPGESNRLMSHLQQARMACDAAGLVDKETEGSPKLDELANLLDELCLQSGLKAVVFSQWEQMTRLVEARVRALGLGCVRLHGGVPTSKRGELIDRFNEDDACQVFISTDAGGVGLNLQTASVLVNLDIPWNPAVLDQRIARVHRLGQTRKVQIVLLVAAESYECRVLELVQGKRNLFDNVVDQDATEDVVGVSRKLVEVLAEDLAGLPGVPKTSAEAPAEQTAEAVLEGTASEQADTEQTPSSDIDLGAGETTPIDDASVEQAEQITLADATENAEMEEGIRHAIEAAQNAFGTRIERILGSGGGLLVVLDRVDAEADRLAAEISGQIPVALIDPRTLSGLRRLGDASPIARARPLVEPSEDRSRPQQPRLLSRAREKLQGAEILIQQACPAPAMDLLLGALLACAAVRAEQESPPTPQQAGIWLYSEALPKGILTQEEAGLLMRALALSQGAEAIPDALLRDLAADIARFVAGTD
jgi:superfamily II DNA or RNA helicase